LSIFFGDTTNVLSIILIQFFFGGWRAKYVLNHYNVLCFMCIFIYAVFRRRQSRKKNVWLCFFLFLLWLYIFFSLLHSENWEFYFQVGYFFVDIDFSPLFCVTFEMLFFSVSKKGTDIFVILLSALSTHWN
jgi:hypothetical protein